MNLSAKNLHQAAKFGFKRIKNFKDARMMFIEAYAGQYYDKDHGELGREPLNLAFNAVRVLVPNLVTRTPVSIVDTDYLAYRQYGELLALALNYMSKKLKLPEVLQRGIVDAIFTLGIFKVGLTTSDSLVYFKGEPFDPGQIYIDTVDLDDFTIDPATRRLDTAAFIGERIRVERDLLLESGMYDNDIVERLPSSTDISLSRKKSTRDLSMTQLNRQQLSKLHDYVDLLELWLPGPNVIVTLPHNSSLSDKFLREDTFYGPNEGPYTFLSLTPPVPNNPFPVSLAGIWHDLHTITNRIAKKTMDQAEAQKDILGYRGDRADDGREIVGAKNLDAVRMDDPDGAKMFSFGGQNPKNERMLAQLELWFNQMSGNTNLTGGLGIQAGSATEVNILQQNAATGITYMRDQVDTTTRKILQNCAWYLHTDPLIKLPLIQRNSIPAEYDITETGIQMISPPRTESIQVFLTPEVREGDFLDFAFSIAQDSMAPINWQLRLQQLQTLAVTIIPAAAAAAQISAQMGTPFSFRAFVTRVAKVMNVDWIDEIFENPDAIAMLATVAQQGPQAQNSKGIASQGAVQQNGGNLFGAKPKSQQSRARQTAQVGANEGQSDLPVRDI